MKYGVKSITMDDVARDLGISKKTLYVFFDNKNDLVNQVTAYHFSQENCAVNEIRNVSKNAIDELLNISSWMTTNMKGMNPTLVYDLRRYHPDSWQKFEQHKAKEVYQLMLNNIHRGIKEELYRNDLHPEILARIYIGRMEIIIDTDLFPPDVYSFQDTHREFITYHIRGLASLKGIKYLEKHQNKTNVA